MLIPFSQIDILTSINVFDIISTSLGGECDGIKKRRQKNQSAHR